MYLYKSGGRRKNVVFGIGVGKMRQGDRSCKNPVANVWFYFLLFLYFILSRVLPFSMLPSLFLTSSLSLYGYWFSFLSIRLFFILYFYFCLFYFSFVFPLFFATFFLLYRIYIPLFLFGLHIVLLFTDVFFTILSAVLTQLCRIWSSHGSEYEDDHRPDDGGSKDLWNVGKLLPDYTALQPRRQPSFNLTFFLFCSFKSVFAKFNDKPLCIYQQCFVIH
jgi:hypothetical protein